MNDHKSRSVKLVQTPHVWGSLLCCSFVLSCTELSVDGSAVGVAIVNMTDGVELCKIDADRPRTYQTELILSKEKEYPCEVVAIPLGVTIGRSSVDEPEPGLVLALREDSGFFSNTRRIPRNIASWVNDGKFLAEFDTTQQVSRNLIGNRALTLMTTASDSLFVFDAYQNVRVFDRDLKLARTIVIGSHPFGASTGHIHLLETGQFLVTAPIDGLESNAFHLFDTSGSHIRSFGPPNSGASYFSARQSAVLDSLFVVAPQQDSRHGYEMELWSTSGHRLMVVRRTTSWAPENGYHDSERLPQFRYLNVDSLGLVWVNIITKDDRWRLLSERKQRLTRWSELYDSRLEVIDPFTGVVLASLRSDPETQGDGEPPFARMILGTRIAYSSRIDPDRGRVIDLYELTLVKSLPPPTH